MWGWVSGKHRPPLLRRVHQFKYLEILAQNVEEKTTASEDSASETLARADLATIKRVVLSILDEISDEDQWVFISESGGIL